MNKILLLFAACILGLTASAQEKFDMPNATGTYLNGINDSGEICGYYTIASGNTLAFEINKYGDTIKLTGPAGSSYAFVNATGISNNGMVVGNYGTSSATAQPYIFEPNPGRNAGGNYLQVPNWGGTNTAASGISADTCISGSYQVGGNDCGAQWCNSGGNVASLRCNNGGTIYPTYAYDIDKNNNVCGFIIEGAEEQTFIYRPATLTWDTFQVGGFLQSKALGMNDNGWICGNYSNGTKGYYCKKLAGQNYTNFTQVIVAGATTVYPCHINNNNDVVGFYTDAQGVDHGFIIATYDIGFRPSHDGFGFKNGNAWPASYYKQFGYVNDPYLHNGTAFLRSNNAVIDTAVCPDWPDYVNANTGTNMYKSVNGHLTANPVNFNKWVGYCDNPFKGSCFGFTNNAGLLFDNKSLLLQHYPKLAAYQNGTTFNYPLNDTTISAITQSYMQQFTTEVQPYEIATFQPGIKVTMQFLKQELRNSRGKPHQTIGVVRQNGRGGHALLPYKLSPGAGGNGVDTIYIYDCNFPGLDGLFITVDLKAGNGGDWHYDGQGRYNDYGGSPNGTGLILCGPDSILINPLHAALNPFNPPLVARSTGYATIAFNDSSQVYLTDDNDSIAAITNTATTLTPLILPLSDFGGLDAQTTKVLTNSNVTTVNKHTLSGYPANYIDLWQDNYFIGCNRLTGTDTTDDYALSSGSITYFNNSNQVKQLAFTLNEQDSSNVYSYYVSQFNLPGSNKVTVKANGNTGAVIQNYGPENTYTITTYFITPDSIITFTGIIPIQANTQHTILPHDTTYSGIYILVDTGMTGHVEDSIFITPGVTAVRNVNTAGIKAWPVPSGNELFMSGPQGLIKYAIVDVTGRTVATGELDFGNGTTQKFNMGGFAPGVYTIAGNGPQGRWTYMFVKQ